MIGGPPAPGIGFSIGEDRLVLAVEEAANSKEASTPESRDTALAAYVAWLVDAPLAPAFALVRELRRQSLSVVSVYEHTELKKPLGAASKLVARFALIIA